MSPGFSTGDLFVAKIGGLFIADSHGLICGIYG
jgi:hypothetical protein